MTTWGPKKEIGRTFEDMLILVLDGEEYLSCKFIRCQIMTPSEDVSFKFYDCEFDSCEFRPGNEKTAERMARDMGLAG